MEKRKVLILGVTGMAGHVIYRTFIQKEGYKVIGISRKEKLDESNIILDVRDFTSLENLVKDIRPDVIVNAIGILINGSKESPSNSILINSYLPHFLVQLARKFNSKLIHISTDCVFSGKQGGYTEDSFRDADDIYGRSKALGEIINDKDLTIRTSIIGPELKKNGEGLFHWFMTTSGVVRGYNNVFWSGVTTFELAKVIEELINSDVVGLIHLTNNKKISKYDLLVLIKEIWKRNNIDIVSDFEQKHDKTFVSNRLLVGINVPAYKEMLVSMRNEMDNALIYSQYRISDL